MKLNGKEVLVCNCEGTMTIDSKALAKACQGSDKKGGGKKAEELSVASHLCRTQIEEFQRLGDGARAVGERGKRFLHGRGFQIGRAHV